MRKSQRWSEQRDLAPDPYILTGPMLVRKARDSIEEGAATARRVAIMQLNHDGLNLINPAFEVRENFFFSAFHIHFQKIQSPTWKMLKQNRH